MASTRLLLILVGLFCFSQLALLSFATPVIKTQNGPVQGIYDSNFNINEYLGIPFAEPPVGQLRWAAPQASQSWTNTRQANKLGPRCPQFANGGVDPNSAEGCLFVNVFTPTDADVGKNYPVFVWIYGGGFTGGSSGGVASQYFINYSHEVIFVSFNYRLGFMGFFAQADLLSQGLSTNFGLLDQQYAIQWVKNNIQAFGGDPERITIGGESAGGASVLMHMVYEDSWPNFNQAIVESGNLLYPNVSSSTPYVDKLAISLGCDASDKQLDCMRNLGLNAFYTGNTGGYQKYFVPSVDGISLLDQPYNLLESGRFKPDTPMIVGNNFNEGDLMAYSYSSSKSLSQADYVKYAKTTLLYTPSETADSIIDAYSANAKSGYDYWNALAQIIGDCRYICSSASTNRFISSTNNNIWRYQFNHTTASISASPFNQLPVTHYTEVPYVFNAGPHMGFNFNDQEQGLSNTMTQYWTNFITSGDPNKNSLSGFTGFVANQRWQAAESVNWPTYNNESTQYIILGLNLRVVTDSEVSDSHCPIWKDYYPTNFAYCDLP